MNSRGRASNPPRQQPVGTSFVRMSAGAISDLTASFGMDDDHPGHPRLG